MEQWKELENDKANYMYLKGIIPRDIYSLRL